MPIFFQHSVDDTTRLGIWKIEETEEFFKGNVPLHRHVTHPHKRLQHLAGRFLLQFLFPDFPYEMIRIAETNKPYLADEQYHFSISHCGDYAAAIVSRSKRVGIDIEIPVDKIARIADKFLGEVEKELFLVDLPENDYRSLTLLWSAKEAIYKWYGDGGVDFSEDIQLNKVNPGEDTLDCYFTKTEESLTINYREFDHLVLAWVFS